MTSRVQQAMGLADAIPAPSQRPRAPGGGDGGGGQGGGSGGFEGGWAEANTPSWRARTSFMSSSGGVLRHPQPMIQTPEVLIFVLAVVALVSFS